MAGCANVYPRTMASIYDWFCRGRFGKAQEYQASIASFRACFKYGNPNTVVKTAVALLGYDVGNAAHRSTSSRKKALPRCGRCFVRNAEKGMH